MKRTPLLNRHLSKLVASLGHLDEIVVADAGFPVPAGVPAIDLAVSPGLPSIFDVIAALRTELVIEAAIHANEVPDDLRGRMESCLADWSAELGKPIAVAGLPHNAFKQRSGSARAVVRTGDFVPYSNVLLICGVAF